MSRPRISAVAPTSATESNKFKGHLFLRNVPVTTKSGFKAACAERNLAMRDVIILLMRKYASAVRRRRHIIRLDDLYQLNADDNIAE